MGINTAEMSHNILALRDAADDHGLNWETTLSDQEKTPLWYIAEILANRNGKRLSPSEAKEAGNAFCALRKPTGHQGRPDSNFGQTISYDSKLDATVAIRYNRLLLQIIQDPNQVKT